MAPRPSVLEIFLVALRLGCTSFGGPVAHLAYFRREYVERRRWLDDAHYADLVALCQFLPGPASSQTGYGIGYLQRGLPGALAAWLGFTLPSALLMIAFALGMAAVGEVGAAGWLNGLKTAAVAVVAHAVIGMWRNLCPDLVRSFLAAGAAAALLAWPHAWTQIALIAGGGVIGGLFLAPATTEGAATAAPNARLMLPRREIAITCLAIFLFLLGALPLLARVTGNPALEAFEGFYRAGALVFGGGHVVLPLLESSVVSPGWVPHDQFLAGYGAAQAVPGPLFTFSAYLGAVASHGPGGWAGGAWALVAVFLPGLLLVTGTLPFWQALRGRPAAQAVLRGTNAAVVGVLLAALITPVMATGLTSRPSLGVACAAFALLQWTHVPAWAVVAGSAALGAVLL
jgi:chromate transporter